MHRNASRVQPLALVRHTGALLLAVLASPTIVQASSHPAAEAPIFLSAEAPIDEPTRLASDSFAATVDETLLAANPDRLRLVLPDGTQRVALRRAFEQSVDGRTTWRGVLDGSETDYLVLTDEGIGVTGHFTASGDAYRLLTDRFGHSVSRTHLPAAAPHQKASSALDTCAVEGVPADSSIARDSFHAKSAADRSACSAPASQIDVLAVYLAGMNGKDVAQQALDDFAEADEIFARSGVPVTYRLIGPRQLTTSPDFSLADPSLCTGGSLSGCAASVALDWLNTEPAEILELRAQTRADMVLLYFPPSPDFTCGKANLPTRGERILGLTGDEPFDKRAFAVNELGCGEADFTTAHELAHVLSLSHFQTDRPTDGLFDFASGHLLPMLWGSSAGGGATQERWVGTFMACRNDLRPDDPQIPGFCDRIPFASNPEVTVDSLKGPVATGLTGTRDNALVACSRGPILAGLQRATGNNVPTIHIREPDPRAAQTINLLAGEPVRLRAEAFDTENSSAFLASRITWRSDRDGFLGSGGSLDVELETLATHLITARVVDAFGHVVERSVSVDIPSFRPDPYEDDDICPFNFRTVSLGLDERDHTFHRPSDRDAFLLSLPEAARVRIRAESLRRSVAPTILRFEDSNCQQVAASFPEGLAELDLPASNMPSEGAVFAVVGPDGLAGPDTLYALTIEAVDLPPAASFSASCTTLRCTFDASSSTGSGLTYSWDLADGSSATGPVIEHLYPRYRTFQPRLTVRDASGRQATTTRTVTLAEPTIEPRIGSWWNPDRSGNGLELMVNDSGEYAMAWYTYDAAGNPTWYLSDTGPKVPGATLAQPLYRFTWDGTTRHQVIVGSVQLRFADPTTAVFDWTLDGQSGRETFTFFAGDGGRTGAWYPPEDDDWGLLLDDIGGATLVTTLSFYDAAGRARWVQGVTSATEGQHTVEMRAFRGLGLCPGCGGGSATPPPSTAAGTLELSLTSSQWELSVRSQITGAAGSLARPWTLFRRLTLPN